MKTHTTNYIDSFIEIAEDCPALTGEVPPIKNDGKSIASMQFEQIKNNPYKFTSDDVLFQVHAERNNLTQSNLQQERENFFSKGQPCFRSSPLTKRYGWGVHFDPEGRMGLYGIDSADYKCFIERKDLKIIKAMRSKRK